MIALWGCGLASGCDPSGAATHREPAPSAPAPQPAPPVAAPAAQAPAPAPAAPPLRFAGTELLQDDLLRALASAEPLSFKPVGSTSTVFHARLKGTVDAAFKAPTAHRPHGPASEVAAYRVSRCLGLDDVPPAISRRIALEVLRARLEPRYETRWPEIEKRMRVGDGGAVLGAAIYWIPELADVGVDKQSGLRKAAQWLRVGGDLPEARRSLAASLSRMLAFDYLIGNFDRWSGDNVAGDAQGRFVYVRDHDQAFPEPMGEALHRKLLGYVLRCERFSRAFYLKLRSFSRQCLQRELAEDPEGPRLLSERQIADLFDRRQTLLSHIESLVALHGEREVLFFE